MLALHSNPKISLNLQLNHDSKMPDFKVSSNKVLKLKISFKLLIFIYIYAL